jgi:hypothetical protein
MAAKKGLDDYLGTPGAAGATGCRDESDAFRPCPTA